MNLESRTSNPGLLERIPRRLGDFLRAHNEQIRLQREDIAYLTESGILAKFQENQGKIKEDWLRDRKYSDTNLSVLAKGPRGSELRVQWDICLEKQHYGRSIWMGREVSGRLRRDPETGAIIGVIVSTRGSVDSATPDNLKPILADAFLRAGAGERWPINPDFMARIRSMLLKISKA